MNVTLLAWTPAPELVVASAGQGCYSSKSSAEILKTIEPEAAAKFIRRIKQSGHLSVLEHAVFTFCVEDVSRALLAQITRHRVASFSVQSQRYVHIKDFKTAVPPEVENSVGANRAFEACMEQVVKTYDEIHNQLMSERLREKYAKYIVHDGLNIAFQNNPKHFYLAISTVMEAMRNKPDVTDEELALYKEFKKDWNAAEKYANENARAVLPNAATTKFTMTMNARELLHFFSLRCCNRAQDEIRELADEMLVLCQQVAPTIFEDAGAPCIRGGCPEGKMTCGHPQGKKEMEA